MAKTENHYSAVICLVGTKKSIALWCSLEWKPGVLEGTARGPLGSGRVP